jgi:hypothetical protein
MSSICHSPFYFPLLRPEKLTSRETRWARFKLSTGVIVKCAEWKYSKLYGAALPSQQLTPSPSSARIPIRIRNQMVVVEPECNLYIQNLPERDHLL